MARTKRDIYTDRAYELIGGAIDKINNEEYESAKHDLDVAQDLLYVSSIDTRELLVDYNEDGKMFYAWKGVEGKISYVIYNYDNGRMSSSDLPYREFVDTAPWFDDIRHHILSDELRRDAMIKLHGEETYNEFYADECEDEW